MCAATVCKELREHCSLLTATFCVQDAGADELRSAMYGLADRYVVLSPEQLAAKGTLFMLMDHSLAVLLARENNGPRAALNFVLHAISPSQPDQQVRTSIRILDIVS